MMISFVGWLFLSGLSVEPLWAQTTDYGKLCKAIGTSQIKPCDTIKNEDTRTLCKAILNVEQKECMKIKNAELQLVCGSATSSTPLATICNSVVNADWKTFCLAKPQNDRKACLKISDIQLKGACYSLVARGDYCVPESGQESGKGKAEAGR